MKTREAFCAAIKTNPPDTDYVPFTASQVHRIDMAFQLMAGVTAALQTEANGLGQIDKEKVQGLIREAHGHLSSVVNEQSAAVFGTRDYAEWMTSQRKQHQS